MDFNGEMTQHQDSAGQWRHEILVRSKVPRNIPKERCREKSTGESLPAISRAISGRFPESIIQFCQISLRRRSPSGSSPLPECHLWNATFWFPMPCETETAGTCSHIPYKGTGKSLATTLSLGFSPLVFRSVSLCQYQFG